MATDLDLARARIAELESALCALSGFTPDDNEWMRRAEEAERGLVTAKAQLQFATNEIDHLQRLRKEALNQLAAERKLRMEGDIKGVASPPPAPIHYPGSDAADALRYMMESRYVAPNPDLIKTVYGVELPEFARILAVDVRP